MNVLLIFLHLVVLYLLSARALDEPEVFGTQNEDCKPYLTHNNSSNNMLNLNSSSLAPTSKTDSAELMCPPWYYRDPEGIGACKPGKDFSSVLLFQINTHQPYLQTLYCMTTSNESSTTRRDAVGSCLFSFDMRVSSYYPLPCNISKLNEYTCAGLNREGQLCGHCVKGFAPPVFSYSLGCVKCTDYRLNWLRYIGVAFGPLTVFCLLICFFHISATSPYLFGFVFYCQILSMPTIVRMAQNVHGYKEAHPGTRFGEKFYVSLISIWNLDIFRAFNEPFCLHPHMTMVQAHAIDYLVALYPLALLLIAFVLVSLYSRNVKVVVILWKPFRSILRPCVRNLNIKTSLIESFATLYFLSAMKVQSVTLDLLSATALYFPDGTISNKLYLYLAGDVEYFGTHHLPYALLAAFFFIIFTLLPGLLFFVYPCNFFQRFLNKFDCNSVALRIFMDAFQGNYKDGTENTKDYRFFSAIFFLARFALMAIFILLNSLYSFIVFGSLVTILGFSVAILHPQRTFFHYILDCTVLVLLSVLFFSITGFFLGPHDSVASQISRYFGFFSVALPLIYILCLVVYWTVAKKRIPQRLGCFIARALASVFFTEDTEQQRLLTIDRH